jgi:hypothetical protein
MFVDKIALPPRLGTQLDIMSGACREQQNAVALSRKRGVKQGGTPEEKI